MPVLKDGNVYKYKLNPNEYSNKWEAIGGLIHLYFKINPQEYRDLLHDIKIIKKQSKYKAMSKDKTWKWGITMPNGLLVEIEKVYPDILHKPGSVQKFLTKFPLFAIPE